MRSVAVVAVAAQLLTAGCQSVEARPQWLVTVSSDAQVPQFGDRLLVEVIDEAGATACNIIDESPGCARELSVQSPADWPVTFGVASPESDERLRIRTRHFRLAYVTAGAEPAAPSLVDTLVALPPTQAISEVGFVMGMDCFGVEADIDNDQSCDLSTASAAPVRLLDSGDVPNVAIASWPPGDEVPCPAEPPAAMRCVPGGAFLFGDHQAPHLTVELSFIPERLAQISPFYLDTDEVTVGDIRPHVVALGMEPIATNPDPSTSDAACTYVGRDDATNDALPANCLSWEMADAYCRRIGKRLPSDAEWEFAAGNRDTESRFPWGDEDDICRRAVIGRGRVTQSGEESFACLGTSADAWGPVAGGNDLDVTRDGVRNLGGSMGEFTADFFAPLTSPCWLGSGVAVDPRCDESQDGRRTVRLSAWFATPAESLIHLRAGVGARAYGHGIGFRCAQSVD